MNANYIRARLAGAYDLPDHDERTCMHEALFSAKRQKAQGVKALDIAKRLIDYGYHPPTMYFPLVVEEALLVGPDGVRIQGDHRRLLRCYARDRAGSRE